MEEVFIVARGRSYFRYGKKSLNWERKRKVDTVSCVLEQQEDWTGHALLLGSYSLCTQHLCICALRFMGNMSWSWLKKKKIQYVYYDSSNVVAVVSFYPSSPRSTAKQLYFQVCLCVFSISLVWDALLAATLILYNIQTPFSNVSLLWPDTCSHKLVSYAVNPSFQCEQTGFISRP